MLLFDIVSFLYFFLACEIYHKYAYIVLYHLYITPYQFVIYFTSRKKVEKRKQNKQW